MARKKYLIKTINFGKKGDLSREIIEQISKNSKTDISKKVREAIEAYYTINDGYKQIKINQLKLQRKDIKKNISNNAKLLEDNENELIKLGYKLTDLE